MIRSTPLRRRTRLRPVSNRQAERLREYDKLRKDHLTAHPICEFPGCTKRSRDVHHTAMRGVNLTNSSTFMALCRRHHNWIHSHPGEARQMGYLPK